MFDSMGGSSVKASLSALALITYPFRVFGRFCGRVVATLSSLAKKIINHCTGKNANNTPLTQRTVSQPNESPIRSALQAALADALSKVDPGSPAYFSSDINIGVLGIACQGKSSVINALRILEAEDYDDPDAPTGVLSSNQVYTERYQFSDHKYLCELPDLEFARYDPEAFAQRSGLEHYDALIIVQKEKIICPEVKDLFRRANSKGIPVYVVRSKFDAVASSEQRSRSEARTNEQLSNIIKASVASQLNSEIEPKNIFTCDITSDESTGNDLRKLRAVVQQVKKRVSDSSQ